MPAGPRSRLLRPLRDRGGMIVLAPLIVFSILLIVLVVGGKIIYGKPRGTYVTQPRPELHYVVSAGEVYAEERVVSRLSPGDRVWVVRMDNGSAVLFRDRTGREAIGVTNALLDSARADEPAAGGG